MNVRRYFPLPTGACLVGLILPSGHLTAAEIRKADSPEDLAVGSSWIGGVVPGENDLAIWDNAAGLNTVSVTGGPLSWSGLRIANPAFPVVVATSPDTLALGAGGIDMSGATQDLTIQCPVTVVAGQPWTVGANRLLRLEAAVAGSGPLTVAGPGQTTLVTGNVLTGGITVTSGARLEIDTATSAGTGPLSLSGGTLAYNPVAGFNLANALSFAAGTENVIEVPSGSGANPAGGGAWTGGGKVTVRNTFSPYTINASMAGFSGTIVLDPPGGVPAQFRLNSGGGNPNTGSAAAVWNLGAFGELRSRNAAVTIHLGDLRGGPGSKLAGRSSGTSAATSTTFSIGALNLDSTFQGTITNGGDATAITKTGTGRLTLTGPCTWSGLTTVSSGVLEAANDGQASVLGTGAIINNAVIILNRQDDFSFPNAVSGSGVTVKRGAGRMTIDGQMTGSGGLRLEAGTLAIGAGSISGPLEVTAGAVLDLPAASLPLGYFPLTQALTGLGTVNGVIRAETGGVINPGAVQPGTLTVSGDLTLAAGSTCHFDLSDDPSGTVQPTDLLQVNGGLTIAGPSSVVVIAMDGSLPPGTYPLIRYTGTLTGNPADLSLSGVAGTLVSTPGQIAVVVQATRPPASLTWKGSPGANLWDENATSAWLNGVMADKFLSGDSVLFNDSGAAASPVTVAGVVLPAAVQVNAAANYIFTGPGQISGNGSLTKSGTGTLTIDGVHSWNGATVINGGALVVTSLGNGQTPSSVGASGSAPSNLSINNGTLAYAGSVAGLTDRGITLGAAGATLQIPDEFGSLSVSGVLTGPGKLIKSGAGTLGLAGSNPFAGGFDINGGSVILESNAANLDGAGDPGQPVTLRGGAVLQLFGYNGSNGVNYADFRHPLVVPAGETGTLRLFQRGPQDNRGISAPLGGAGTLELIVSYIRGGLDGDWSAFTGRIHVSIKPGLTAADCRINNLNGYAAAAMQLNDGVHLYRNGGANTTTDIGELSGTPGAVVGIGNLAQGFAVANPTWRVGARGTDATFDGVIINDGITSITKTGAGTWTLTGENTYTGTTRISQGVLAISGSLPGSTPILVEAGAELRITRPDQTFVMDGGRELGGNGKITGNLISNGGVIAPGENSAGTLTVAGALALDAGTIVRMDWGGTPAASDKLTITGALTLGGNLEINGSFTLGDSVPLFTAGSVTGAFASIQPPPGPGLAWDASKLASEGRLVVVEARIAPAIDSITLTGNLVTGRGINAASNALFEVLTAPDAGLPLAQWIFKSSGTAAADGSFTFQVPVTAAREFIRVRFLP